MPSNASNIYSKAAKEAPTCDLAGLEKCLGDHWQRLPCMVVLVPGKKYPEIRVVSL